MNAVISGHAGVALLLDGPELMSIHVEDLDTLVPRKEAEAHLLFGGAKDLQFLEDVTLDQVQGQLELDSARIDALHLCLIILDGDLTKETRQEAAGELNELLALWEVTDFLETILYAQPLPASADLAGAVALCSSAPRVEDLLQALASLRDVVLEVHRAWEAIPSGTFNGEDGRSTARALFAREGLFRELVLNRREGTAIQMFLRTIWLKPAIRKIPSYFRILEEWLAYFQEPLSGGIPAILHAGAASEKGELLESLSELEQEIAAAESMLQSEPWEAPEALSVYEVERFLLQVMPKARRVVERFRIPSHEAEGLIQNALIAFAFHWRDVKNPEAWFLGTVKNSCVIFWRRYRRSLYSSVDETVMAHLSREGADRDETGLRQDLSRLLAKLPPELSSRLRLRYGLDPVPGERASRSRIHESIEHSLASPRKRPAKHSRIG